MKPSTVASEYGLPVALGVAGIPFLKSDIALGVSLVTLAGAGAMMVWRRTLRERPQLPALSGQVFAPVDISISWRTTRGEHPTSRRNWRAVLTESDLWLCPAVVSWWRGNDRDHIRIPRLDIVEIGLVGESELRLRFLDDESRIQEIRLSRLPHASGLAAELGIDAVRDYTRGL